jgi:hypothetical protein
VSCPAYWRRRVSEELRPAYPTTRFVQARAYGIPREVDGVVIDGVEPDPGDPIRQMRKFLKAHPDDPPAILMYHRAGGFTYR